jgi:5-methyltetrahydropteroyltriglutamate--homocysteine methyltransferase
MVDLRDVRVDHVGSLLRPAKLRDAFAAHERGEIATETLRAIQDEAVAEVIVKQESLGFPVVTDGEYRRINFQDGFGASVGGFAAVPNSVELMEVRSAGATPGRRWDPGYAGEGPAIVHRRPLRERLHVVTNRLLDEYRFASAHATAAVKVTVVGADRVLQRLEYEHSRHVYRHRDELIHDLVAVYRQLLRDVVDAGCRYVQFDEPGYTAYVDIPSLTEMRGRGEDPSANLALAIHTDNELIRDIPGVTFGVHLCRGNQRSAWHREGGYDAIAEQLFNGLHHDRLLLEFDTDRAGSFAPLRFVPKGKTVVLGLVSTKTAGLEDADELQRRLEQASRYLPVEQLALSPQCGFSSDITGNLLSEDDQWRKLELVLRVAEDVWGSATVASGPG